MTRDAAADPPPRVLHVAQPTDGGVGRYVDAVSADQRRRGWTVAVACPADGWLAGEVLAARGQVADWPATRSPGPGVLCEAMRLRRVAAGFRPDVVHLHSSKAGLAGRLALRGTLPTLFQPHCWSWQATGGAAAAAARSWERTATRWTGLLVCVGEGEAVEGQRRGLRGPMQIVRNGVDLHRFGVAGEQRRRVARIELGVDPGAELAVCVGRVTRQKGQDVLVDAWSRLRADRTGAGRGGRGGAGPGQQLVVVGDGELLAGLRGRGAEVGVRFVPAVDDVRSWLAAADVVVVPSRWEGLSLTLLEALATGRPVVASDIPGLAEAVSPAVGELVTAGDPAALAEALGRALRDSRPAWQRQAWRVAARAVATGFDATVTLDRLAALTDTLATRPTDRSRETLTATRWLP